MMRIGLLVLLGVSATTARASFDLMLLGDNTTAGSERVVRYDPVNRVVLGSFGTGFINSPILDIAVDSATGTAYVITSSGVIRSFNYNTGEFISAFQTPGLYGDLAFDPNSNLLMAGGGSGGGTSPGRAYNSAGTAVHAYQMRFIATALRRRPGASWYAGFAVSETGQNINAVGYNLTGGIPSVADVVGPAATSQAPRNSIFTSSNRLVGISSDPNANSINLWTVNTTLSGYTGSITIGSSLGPANVNANIVNGHGSLAYILAGGSLITYHTDINMVLGSQSLSFAPAANIRGMAIVLAPEPGTMAALGLGLAAVLRRRTRKS